ncbi:MAG TPA: hypothetical protein VFQ05_13565 [Candidatus Eisenbacteria bacterium]|nr:hypothetical protein [Candidatus Eisenbacteria bacterium]
MSLARGARLASLVIVASLCSASARSEESVLVFERLSRTSTLRPPSQGGPVVVDSTRSEVMVALGDHRLVAYEPTSVWIYDFARKRVQRVNTRDQVYSDWSLHSFVAFKEMELQERLATRRRMEKARPGTEPSVLEMEALFSIQAPPKSRGRRETLADSVRDGRLTVWINGRVSLEAMTTDTAFAPGRAHMFDRYLAFQANIHPDARRALMRLGKVPRQIIYRYRDFNQETVVMLRLVRIASAPEANDPAAMAKRLDLDDPRYRELDQRLAGCKSCKGLGDWVPESQRFEAAALDSGRFLEAALARAERVMGACERDSAWSREIERRVRGDSAIAACRAGLAWRDSASAAAALQRLDRVNGSGLERAYVLDYLRGRARIATHHYDLAAYLMMGALGGNPCMAAGWLDLADLYMRSYQPVLAWMCLEAAEEVGSPGRCEPRLAQRAKRERELEKRYPELFE